MPPGMNADSMLATRVRVSIAAAPISVIGMCIAHSTTHTSRTIIAKAADSRPRSTTTRRRSP
jgi:hypothetical protein